MVNETFDGTTGESVRTWGLYKSDCSCRAKVEVRVEERFPKCLFCHQPVTWSLVRSIGQAPQSPDARDPHAPQR